MAVVLAVQRWRPYLANIPSNVDLSLEAKNMAERIAKLHKEVTNQIKKMNEK